MMRTLVICFVAALVGTAPAMAVDPYAKPDDSWISITGTVANPTADSFILDYGDGVITVEMDDWDSYGDAYGLLDGDKVTVYGEVDNDLFEIATIEAGSVYVENLNTYFYASSADEEVVDYTTYYWAAPTPLIVSDMVLRGTVTKVDEVEGEFMLDTGLQEMTVEIEELGYNPLDEFGYQKIETGDRVSVSGEIDYDFLEGRVFDAHAVVTLSDASLDDEMSG